MKKLLIFIVIMLFFTSFCYSQATRQGYLRYIEERKNPVLAGAISLILPGSGEFYNGKYFNSEGQTLTDGMVKKNYLHYLIGLDFTLWDIRLSSQFIQQTILNYDEHISNDEFENTMTVLVSKDFLRETLRLELFSYIGFNNSDALIRPKITYDLADGFELLLGANIFVGSKGRFGQYDNNDMAYTKIKYSF